MSVHCRNTISVCALIIMLFSAILIITKKHKTRSVLKTISHIKYHISMSRIIVNLLSYIRDPPLFNICISSRIVNYGSILRNLVIHMFNSHIKGYIKTHFSLDDTSNHLMILVHIK